MSPSEAVTPSSPEADAPPLSGRWLRFWQPQHQPAPGWVAALALLGAFNPAPIALAGIHHFYLGRPRWGVLYLLLGWTPIPRVACALEGVGYLVLALHQGIPGAWPWPRRMPQTEIAAQAQAIATAIRELDRLRQEGLITEREFEQQRRQLLGEDG